jgi:hypothetical protein
VDIDGSENVEQHDDERTGFGEVGRGPKPGEPSGRV